MLERYYEWREQLNALNYALTTISWDANTEAPKESVAYRSKMVGILSKQLFTLMTTEDYRLMIRLLAEQTKDANLKRELLKHKKEMDRIVKIPKEEYVAFQSLIIEAQNAWEEAKEKNDWNLFKDYLKKIVETQRNFLKYYGAKEIPYNLLLDDYEEGMTLEQYDQFFLELKTDLVPFVKEVIQRENKTDMDFISKTYPKELQKQFVEYIMEVLYFNTSRGVLKESVHPFTSGTHSKDVRFTVAYHEDYFISSIFSALHELGHALYEQQINPELDGTNLGTGTSMGIHESQSRFYENHIGRSKVFWETHYPKLKELFPNQLEDVSVEDFYQAINYASATFIRTESDELTYPLHIMLRYEIERDLFNNTIEVDDLPKIWNERFTEYFGITPSNDQEGVLQDVHWSNSLFGYFPTYALGSAISAQIEHAMIKDLDLEACIKKNEIYKINEWLKTHIHQYGATLTPREVLKNATNQEFSAKYYIQYLKNKYSL